MKLHLGIVLLPIAAAACYAQADYPAGTTTITSAPVDIDTYPSVIYQGQPVYFYGDRWWYRDGDHWSHYEHEPAELRRQREHVRRDPREGRHEERH